jgi:hypothetical protein
MNSSQAQKISNVFIDEMFEGKHGLLLPPIESVKKQMKEVVGGSFEDMVVDKDPNAHIVKVSITDSVALAMHHAFKDHLPYVWTPDTMWLRIAQGFATHIRLNAEELRIKIVDFEGKHALKYRNDSFVKGEKNDWTLFVGSMANQIGKNANSSLYETFTKPFSTTKPIHTAVANGLLMDACQHYFSYTMITMCGIPSIEVRGTTQDWEDVYERAQVMQEYGLEVWWEHLQPILHNFIKASQGEFDPDFWRSMYKYESQSGGDIVTGWVANLYPYLAGDGKNKRLFSQPSPAPTLPLKTASRKNRNDGIYGSIQSAYGEIPESREEKARKNLPSLSADQLTVSQAVIPFTWEYYKETYDMQLVVGSYCVQQDRDTRALSPAYCWVVRYAPLF